MLFESENGTWGKGASTAGTACRKWELNTPSETPTIEQQAQQIDREIDPANVNESQATQIKTTKLSHRELSFDETMSFLNARETKEVIIEHECVRCHRRHNQSSH